jgi:hypothetical protein
MVGTRAALAATKLPFVPARYKPLAAGVGFIGGTLAGALADLKTGASEKVNTTIFGEAEPLLPSDQITADAFSMMGGFTTFSGVMRNQLKKNTRRDSSHRRERNSTVAATTFWKKRSGPAW